MRIRMQEKGEDDERIKVIVAMFRGSEELVSMTCMSKHESRGAQRMKTGSWRGVGCATSKIHGPKREKIGSAFRESK